ncbi:MAG: endonuclease domain-containing protein [candidate division Zixibacteria bacterium]|nr:endonuclease domain-containing protein [candidate division Zixibacteria bacterium]
MTPAERKLWAGLRDNRLGVRFRRQVPIGEYVADFLSMKNKLIVEVDGSQHLQSENAMKDQKRDAYFHSQGFTVLRYLNSEVLQNHNSVLQDISNRIRCV